MKASTLAFLMVIAACAAGVSAQQGRRSPHIGFVYPAGGQQGTTIHVLVGGQYLRGAADAYISGQGVRASVIQYYPPLRNLDRKQREELARRLRELIEKRWADLAEEGRVDPNPPWRQIARKRPSRPKTAGGAEEARTEAVELPAHPLLSDLEKKDLRALLHVRNEFSAFGKRQPNAQIAESVLVEVTIDSRATPGDRELRLRTRLGLTNPIVFQVGTLAETREQEPDDPVVFDFLPEEPPLSLPILVNGQIMPGDIDRFRFHARRGQTLVIEAHARRLIPYLADAVPGWFQATLALSNAEGDEVAFVDDYRFDPDPVLFYEVPDDGAYELEIRDSIYRGREDFVYRISMGEQPFITSVFPLGTRARQRRSPSVDGWNLPNKPLWLDYKPGAGDVRHTRLRRGEHSSNSIVYAVDTLRDTDESEPNDTAENARRIGLPVIVNGCITYPDDIDTFRFEGRAGDEVVA